MLKRNIMNFIEENQLDEKKVVFLNYILNHDNDNNIWNFDIALNKEYQFLFEDAENNNIGLIFSKQNKIILNSPTTYFVLDKINKDALIAFDKKETFYFKIHNESIDISGKNIINTLSLNVPEKTNT